MRKVFIIIMLLSCLTIGNGLTFSEQNGAIDPNRILPKDLTVRNNEFKLLKKLSQKTKPMDFPPVPQTQMPSHIDYSSYVTFHRNQDGWGGCFHYAALHIMDILNDWEHPYTPDLSYRCLDYYGHIRFDSMPNETDRAQIVALAFDGVCSEASLPSNYDFAKIITTDTNKDGFVEQIWDFNLFQGDMPIPNAQNKAEANLYKVKMSTDYKPTVDSIRYSLMMYGPIWAGGNFIKTLGLDGTEGHVIAIVGYDDDARVFKCLNSGREDYIGYFNLKYDDTEADLWSYRYIQDLPSDRTNGRYAYSARIKIYHPRRNSLTIRIGVEGEPPMTVWDKPNRKNLIDDGPNLTIDVPLPKYASAHWPPRQSKKAWYIQVSDSDTDSSLGQIDEFTLARLYKDPLNRSIGRYQTESFRPKPFDLPTIITDTGTVKLQFPSRGTGTVNLSSYDVNLESRDYNVPPGTPITVKATVKVGNKPVSAGFLVRLVQRRMPLLGNMNKPEEFIVVNTAETDQKGQCSFKFTTTGGGSKMYAAAIIRSDGVITGSSRWIEIGEIIR